MYQDIESTHAIARRPMQDTFIGPTPEEQAQIEERQRRATRWTIPIMAVMLVAMCIVVAVQAKDRAREDSKSTFICTPTQSS